MKRILLTTASLFAFAGAAAADGHLSFGWSGSATVKYNDDFFESSDGEAGVDFDVDIDLSATTELDNGVSVSLSYGFELEDGEGASDEGFSADENALITVTSDIASLYYGDTEYAPVTYWSGVTNMENDGFSEGDGEDVLRGEYSSGSVTAGLSYAIDKDGTAATGTGDFVQLGLGVVVSLDAFELILAYQEETDDPAAGSALDGNGDFNENEVLGLAASGSFGGADVTFAYTSEADEDSTGIEVAYPVGPVTVTVFYVSESAVDDNYGLKVAYAEGPLSLDVFYHDGNDEDEGINIAYEVSDVLSIFVGTSEDDGSYLGAEYDLGGGASVTFSYGDDDGNDEIGPQEYLDGTTLALSLDF